MSKELYIYSATANENVSDTLIYRSICRLLKCKMLGPDNWRIDTSNTVSLSERYNSILNDSNMKDKIVLFVHDDVLIDDMFVVDKIEAMFERRKKCGVIGIAGGDAVDRVYSRPQLWHLMVPKEHMYGEVTTLVEKYSDIAKRVTTSYGLSGKPCLIIDGCFMAVDVERIGDVRFDDKCPSKFNFYDLIFSIRCVKSNIEVVVAPIHIVHASPGLLASNNDFVKGNKYFIDNYLSRM